MKILTSHTVMLNLMGRDWLASCHNLIPMAVDYSITFKLIACPGFLVKVVAGLAGFRPDIIVAVSFFN